MTKPLDQDAKLRLANVNPTMARREVVTVKEQGGKFLARKDGGDTDFLVRYLKQRSIDREMYQAGKKIFSDWSRSGLDPWASAPDTTVYTGGQRMPGMGPRAVEYHAAMRALGTVQGSLVRWVCIENRRVSAWAVDRGWKGHEGMAALKVALLRLAEHYDRAKVDEVAGQLGGMG